ncbi:MAG TPA: GAF domain-containing protein, partial [Aggregatilineales bacterium]|nr:GAF domain-containing protein [Aggregatilineales bacterium]
METAQVNRLMVEITRLSSTAGEVHNLLAAQQKVLKMRGDFQLDEELLTQIESTHREIDRVREILAIQQPELAQLRALVRTMSMINSTLDLNKILNDVMDTFVDLTDAERGLIVLLDPITHEMEFRVVSGMDEDTINKANFMVSRTVVESVASSGEPVITTNALEDKAYEASQSIISYAVRSIICVPLKVKQQVIGVVYLDHRYRQAAFGENELQFLAAF